MNAPVKKRKVVVANPATPIESGDLYAARIKVQPKKVSGFFRTLKWRLLFIFLTIYYATPFIRFDRGPGAPDQAVLADLDGRRGYFFWIEIWPQEVYYLAGLMILGAVCLFCVTAIAGRVWCGYACPQTVWTDLFMWIERLIEGDRSKRLKLDQAPMSVEKAAKRLAKHTAWLVISAATGGAFVLYFGDAYDMIGDLFTGEASALTYSMAGIFTSTTYILGGWAREQVCIYMCPWPRFQGSMFDKDSLVVTYEEWRGEPRGQVKKNKIPEGAGHCVDCTLCVQVCPTGIDIRDGQQMGCIGCGLCIDACNGIMDKFGLPRDLITYDSISNMEAREAGEKPVRRIFRLRTYLYFVLITAIVGVLAFSLGTRERLDTSVLRDRAPMFVRLSGGDIRNGYTYKILNMEREVKHYVLTIEGLDQAAMNVIGVTDDFVKEVELKARPDAVETYRIFIRSPRSALQSKSTDITFKLTDKATGEVDNHASVFAGPGN